MKTRSKILLGVGASILVILAYFAYIMVTTRSHSPAATATYSGENLDISVNYCRPFKKGRLIFGAEDDGALQPWGKYWRAGANEATQIKFAQDVVLGGQTLDAGEYVLYAVPGEGEWIIGINTELGRWGAFEVDHNLDVMQVSVPQGNLPTVQEQFLIDFTPTDDGVNLNLKWDKTVASVEIVAQ